MTKISDSWQFFRLSEGGSAWVTVPSDHMESARGRLLPGLRGADQLLYGGEFRIDVERYRCRLGRIKGYRAPDGGHTPYIFVKSDGDLVLQ